MRLEKNTIEELVLGFERIKDRGKIAAVRTVGHKADFAELKMDLFTWRGTLFDMAVAVRQIKGYPGRIFFIYGGRSGLFIAFYQREGIVFIG